MKLLGYASIFVPVTRFLLFAEARAALEALPGTADRSVRDGRRTRTCFEAIAKLHLKGSRELAIVSFEPVPWSSRLFDSYIRIVARSSRDDLWLRQSRLDGTVLAILNGADLREDLRVLRHFAYFHPRDEYLVGVTRVDRDPTGYLNALATHLTRLDRRAIFLVEFTEPSSHAVRLFGYTNYSHGSCGRPSLVDYGDCAAEESRRRIFLRITNLNRCEVKATIFPLPFFTESSDGRKVGVERKLFDLVFERLNATQVELSPVDDNIVDLGSRVRRAVIDGKADLGYGLLMQMDVDGAVYTYSYMMLQAYMVMPKRGSKPLWMNLVSPLQGTVWLYLGASLLLAVVVTRLVPIFREEFPSTYIGAGFFGTGEPRGMSRAVSKRLYFLSWTLFGYIITQAYLASLTGLLTKSSSLPEFQTLDELEASDYPVGGIVSMREQLLDTNPRLYERYELLKSVSSYLKLLEQVFLGRKRMAIHAIPVMIRAFERGQPGETIHVIPEILRVYPTAALFPETSTIFSSCDFLVTSVVEAGLFDMWQRQFFETTKGNETERRTEKERDDGENSRHVKISLGHLQGVFLIFAIGVFLSLVIFFFELLVERKKNRASIGSTGNPRIARVSGGSRRDSQVPARRSHSERSSRSTGDTLSDFDFTRFQVNRP